MACSIVFWALGISKGIIRSFVVGKEYLHCCGSSKGKMGFKDKSRLTGKNLYVLFLSN